MDFHYDLEGKRILVAGGTGLVGQALLRELCTRNCHVLSPSRAELDLLKPEQTRDFFLEHRPEAAILAAARVGGIGANSQQPYEFLVDNLRMEINFLSAAHESDVARLVFLGSSCIYPRIAEQPMAEDSLLSGHLEPTNSAYAIAKLAGIEFVKAVRSQFLRRWISILPSNLYGPGDNFNSEASHVVPALLRKIHEAKVAGSREVTLWGTGTVRREFLYSQDAARGILFAMERYDDISPINIGSGKDVTIAELAAQIASVIGFAGDIRWNVDMPDGVPRKLLDSTRISALGWSPTVSLHDGLVLTYSWMNAQEGVLRQ